MKTLQSAMSVLVLLLVATVAPLARAQRSTEVRRAQPVDDTPVPRALPAESVPSPTPRKSATPRSVTTEATDALTSEPPPAETESPDKRQLDYANALFGRKLYDLAIPEYKNFSGNFPPRRAGPAHFSTRANATVR